MPTMDFEQKKRLLEIHDNQIISLSSMNAAIGSLIFIFVKSFLLTIPFFVIMTLGLFAWFPRKLDETNIDMADMAKTNVLKIQIVLSVFTFITVAWLVARDIKIY